MRQHFLAVATRILSSEWQTKWAAHQPFPILGRDRWFSGVTNTHSFLLVAVEPAPPTHPEHRAGIIETYITANKPTRRVVLRELLDWADAIAGPCAHCGRNGDPVGTIDGIGVDPLMLLYMRGLERGGVIVDTFVPVIVSEAPFMFFGDGWIFGLMGRTDARVCSNFETRRS
jgi:hypothetical protein